MRMQFGEGRSFETQEVSFFLGSGLAKRSIPRKNRAGPISRIA